MKRGRLPACAAAFSLAAAFTVAAAGAQPAPRPNIVFILADDLGYGDLGSYGQKLVQTPSLDRFAAEGLRFAQFYAGSTVCAPSRSVLMTGRHMGHTRVRGNAGAGNYAAQTLAAADLTVARVLQQAGYATALIGKWGLGEIGSEGEPNRQGFDYFYGFVNQTHAHNHYPDFLWRNAEKVALRNVVTPVGSVPGAGYATTRVQYANDLFFEEAGAFIDRTKDRPFFLFLSLTVPHANNERARALGDGQEVPDYGPYAATDWAAPLKGQAAMITRMDRQIGGLLAQLKRLGLDERTLVVFTSDNGPHKEGGPAYDPDFFDANGPFSGIKRSLTDGGIRVPFLARWPGRIQAGRTSPHVGYFGDMMATFADLAGTKPPAGLDSLSLVPAMLGRGTQATHEYLYWEFYEGGFDQAVLLEGRWKGIRLKSPGAPIRLYDLAADPGEQTDLAGRNPALVGRIGAIMRDAHVDNEHWKRPAEAQRARPNIVLMMADDQGWGETGYYGHPYVRTPVLDEMARTGLRLDRFYAASPVCSPTRASVMTGRHANRSGAFAANWSTRPEEITIARILKQAGYRTAHFGKWHLGPVKRDSPLNPARMGFDEYLSHDNFFEMNPPLSRNGGPPEIVPGEGSEVIVDAAAAFTRKVRAEGKPFFVVIDFGSPHDPYSGTPEDVAPYARLGAEIGGRFAEIAAMDRAIGSYRATLDALGVRRDTLVWFNSDNGISWEGIPEAQRKDLFNGGWRGRKEALYEGGLLVPAIVEWPAAIRAPRQSSVRCVTSDILPTVLDLLGLTHPAPGRPLDGISLKSLIADGTMSERPRPIGFWKYAAQDEKSNPRWLPEELSRGTTPTTRNPGILFLNFTHPVASTAGFGGEAAWTDNRYKLIVRRTGQGGGAAETVELYDLIADPKETSNLAPGHADIIRRMTSDLRAWQQSVERRLSGADY